MPVRARRWHTGPTGALSCVTLALMAIGSAACTTPDEALPPNVSDPTALHNPAGAIARYLGVTGKSILTFENFVTRTGILTDELVDSPTPATVAGLYTDIDSRWNLAGGFEKDYNALHGLRGQAREARGFVQAYAPDISGPLAGHLYALEGYAEIWLADLFCSGIPLSTVDFNGDYTLAARSSTEDVYRHAVALFDSAAALLAVQPADSVTFQFQQLAAVGKGRALLALGRYADAAAAVAAVSDDYQYLIVFDPLVQYVEHSLLLSQFVSGLPEDSSYQHSPATPGMADNEGTNGLDYRSSGDPRTPFTLEGNDILQHPYYFPAKHHESGPDSFAVASGIEARLIEAEAALQASPADGRWLDALNHLRQTAIVAALPNLDDPGPDAQGTDAPRVNLLFRERAFWLYLTGHRQGDLRRLIRQYGRAPTQVYPTGAYAGGRGSYGNEVVAPVPASEQQANPLYVGCFHTNA